MSIHTILGAGGVIANGLAKELLFHQVPVRMVSRRPVAVPGTETFIADLTDEAQTLRAVQGSDVVYLCVGLPYDFSVWRRQWPRIITNTIEACRQTQAKLIFFDNVYMYGRIDGIMTEDSPYDPSSRKGDLRARIATQLMSEVRKGNITATIARAADFYGPGAARTGIPNLLVFQRLFKDQGAQWLVNAFAKHSFTYTGDAVKALYILASDPDSWNQAWHLPTTSSPLTGRDFIEQAAAALGKAPRYVILPEWKIRLGGWFDKTTSELYEMLYQYEFDYIFDSSKFEKAYNYQPVPYGEGIRATANAYKENMGV